jgi:sortase A
VVREVGLALVTAGVVVLLFVAYELVGTNFTEEHSQSRLARQFHTAVHSPAPGRSTTTSTIPPTTGTGTGKGAGSVGGGAHHQASTTSTSAPKPPPAGPPLPLVPPGGALDHLVVPAIGVNRYVVEGVSTADLQMGPGHYPGTPLPGQRGNVAIAGHRTTFGAPFFELNRLVPGDLVYLTDIDANTWVYRVQRQWVVAPSDVGVLAPTPGPELTLTTCNPRFEATSRLVVRAELVKRYRPGATLPSPLPARHVPATGARTVSTLPPAVPTTTLPGSSSPGPGAGGRVTTTTAGGDNPTVGPGGSATGGAGQLGGGAPGAWKGTLGWAVAALLCWLVVRLAAYRRRGGAKAAVILGGALACLVPLWFAFENVVNLLPANI